MAVAVHFLGGRGILGDWINLPAIDIATNDIAHEIGMINPAPVVNYFGLTFSKITPFLSFEQIRCSVVLRAIDPMPRADMHALCSLHKHQSATPGASK